MGVNVTANSDIKGYDLVYGLKTERHSPAKVEVWSPKTYRGFGEIHISMLGCTTERGVMGERPPVAQHAHIRIHGVTVSELLNALIEDTDAFRYLATAVDFRRENPSMFQGPTYQKPSSAQTEMPSDV